MISYEITTSHNKSDCHVINKSKKLDIIEQSEVYKAYITQSDPFVSKNDQTSVSVNTNFHLTKNKNMSSSPHHVYNTI